MALLRNSMSRVRPNHLGRVLPFVLLAALALPSPAFGYIDPATGSLILQVVAAALLASLLTVKRFWMRVTTLFRRDGRAVDE